MIMKDNIYNNGNNDNKRQYYNKNNNYDENIFT